MNAGNEQRLPSWALPVVGGLIGGVLMTAALGPSIVNPLRFEWLMHGDYALHFLGWHLYRHGPWTTPIGAAPLLIAPIGSSIGLTDSIPLVGIPLKIFDALMPPIFQFIGAWLVLSVALQGVFGVLLMRLVTPRATLQLLGATLIVLSPPLFYRINHAALTAHWLVLASLWLSIRHDADVPSVRLATAWALLAAAAAATQPYILLMVMVLMGAAHLRQVLSAPRQIVRITAHAAFAVVAAGVALWQSGSLMVRAEDGLEVGGFGIWSSNLLAFIMPTEGFTLLYPGMFRYHHKEQYEGYAYLGLGMLFLLAIAIVGRMGSSRAPARTRRLLWYAPLGLALLFLWAMAVGPTINAGERTLLAYDMSWWGPLRIFRTSGRMIWPVYYATVIAILFALARFEHRRAVLLASIALVTQAVDLAGMGRYVRDVQAFGFRDPLENRFWTVVPQYYDDLVLVPPNFCAQEGYLDFGPFALRAGVHGVSINSGMTARFDVRRARLYCRELREEIRSGVRPDGSLYVVRPDIVPDMMQPGKDETMCTVIDRYGVCFSARSYARWRDVFDLPRSRLPDTAEFVRFYKELDDAYHAVLGRAEREVEGTTDARIEGLVGYLAARMEGCDHLEAERRIIGRLDGQTPLALCSAISMQHELPPADQTLAFATRLSDALRGRAAPGRTHVDAEGEAVWLQTYAGERARGAREVDARATVLNAIRGGK